MSDKQALWDRFCQWRFADPQLGLALDISRVRFPDDYFTKMARPIADALAAMDKLEQGSLANASEQRMVGHYWLRDAALAPEAEITSEINETLAAIKEFAKEVHAGQTGFGEVKHLLHIGIGGSALGPQLVAHALGNEEDKLQVHFLDNTDPDGIDDVLGALSEDFDSTLVTVVSKSGGTPETRNGMLEAQAAFKLSGVDFAAHAVAITQAGSRLDKIAVEEKWIKRFPMWDWVGGRTSVMSAVGLVPAALQGIDVQDLLDGAAAMDKLTRNKEVAQNPAALLALMWYYVGGGEGAKDMVILPYKDRLSLLSRYLQQLVMESLGKATNRQGEAVQQGIAVYGNKGSTDQHAYVQQLRDGLANFFATFIQVLTDRDGDSLEVEDGTTAGDFLFGFLQGTRAALYENDRDSITISIEELTPKTLGALIALYERTVGLYAELVNVNAYDQPGVEAGKKAAAGVLDLQGKAVAWLRGQTKACTAAEVANGIGSADQVEMVFKILEHLSANPTREITVESGESPSEMTFAASSAASAP